jgi:hypothetical protein
VGVIVAVGLGVVGTGVEVGDFVGSGVGVGVGVGEGVEVFVGVSVAVGVCSGVSVEVSVPFPSWRMFVQPASPSPLARVEAAFKTARLSKRGV